MTDGSDPVQQAREWLAARMPEGDPGRGPVPAPTTFSAGSTSPADPTFSAGSSPPPTAAGEDAEAGAARSAGPGGPARGAGTGPGRRRRGRPAEDPDGRHDGPDADPETLARTIVLRKLTSQARTRQQLADALADRDVPDDTAATVLDRMEEVGLVDDGAFARDWVESRQSRRRLSRSALRRELITRGVGREHIDEALAQVDEDDELEAARALVEKKLRSMSRLEPEVQYRRLAGALARRGFSSGIASRVLEEYLRPPI